MNCNCKERLCVQQNNPSNVVINVINFTFNVQQPRNAIRVRFIALLFDANNSVIIVGGAQICGSSVHFLVGLLLILTLKKRKTDFSKS